MQTLKTLLTWTLTAAKWTAYLWLCGVCPAVGLSLVNDEDE